MTQRCSAGVGNRSHDFEVEIILRGLVQVEFSLSNELEDDPGDEGLGDAAHAEPIVDVEGNSAQNVVESGRPRPHD